MNTNKKKELATENTEYTDKKEEESSHELKRIKTNKHELINLKYSQS
ncbi:hypothetical protein JEZ13_09520 [bacterium]|nr:hypothetical protein [bacterium]